MSEQKIQFKDKSRDEKIEDYFKLKQTIKNRNDIDEWQARLGQIANGHTGTRRDKLYKDVNTAFEQKKISQDAYIQMKQLLGEADEALDGYWEWRACRSLADEKTE